MNIKSVAVGLAVSLMVSVAWAETAREMIAQGDAFYTDRIHVESNQKALVHYRAAMAAEPQNSEAHWKAARAAWWLGTRSKGKSVRMAAFEEGVRYGEIAVKLTPQQVEPHFWLGGNYASFGETKGAFTSLMLIKKIRKEMAEVNRIDERYMEAGGHRILAILDFKVPGIVGGDKGRARHTFDRALAIAPNNPVTVFYLADFYASTGEKLEALQTLDKLDTLKPSPEFEPEFIMMKEQAIPLRKKL